MTLGLALLASLSVAVQDAPATSPSTTAAPVTIAGVVRDASGGLPVPGAQIHLVGTDRYSTADSDGRYELAGIPYGVRRVQVRRFGFRPLDVDLAIPRGGSVALDFHLEVAAVLLPTVNADVAMLPVGHGPPEIADAGAGLPADAAVRDLDVSPGVGGSGIGAGAEALLGPDPPAPDNILYVRGAGAALGMVLLDGAPVHAPFHLGGLLSPGLPPSIARAERLQGGLTARYDGGLADVLLLESRPGAEGTAASAYVDMLAAGGAVETASPNVGGVFVSVRSLHGAGGGGLLSAGFPQRYRDALVRTDLLLAGGDTLSVTGFHNEESVRLPGEAVGDAPRWGNRAGSLRYRGITRLGRMELGGALGSFDTRLPVGADGDPLIATGATRRARAWADFGARAGPVALGFGIQGERLGLRTRFRERDGAEQRIRLNQRAGAGAVGVWFEGARTLARRLDVTAGIRANFMTDDLGQSVSPRVRLGYRLTDATRLVGSFGQFQQLVVTVDSELPLETTVVTDDEGTLLGSVTSKVASSRARHFVMGVTHAPSPRSMLEVEVFWKASDGIPSFGAATLQTTGVDVTLNRAIAPELSLWGAYTVGWAWAEIPGEISERVYAGRHFLRGGIAYDAPQGVRLTADLSLGDGLEFGAIPRSERGIAAPGAAPATAGTATGSSDPAAGGSPGGGPAGRAERRPDPRITPLVQAHESTRAIVVPDPGGPPGFTGSPSGSYVRLNVQARATFDVRMFGKRQTLMPYFRIVNALDRNDALFFQYDGDDGRDPRPLGHVPILPVIGVEWRL